MPVKKKANAAKAKKAKKGKPKTKKNKKKAAGKKASSDFSEEDDFGPAMSIRGRSGSSFRQSADN